MKIAITVILEPEEDGGYSVHCPALHGCSSQGDTERKQPHHFNQSRRDKHSFRS